MNTPCGCNLKCFEVVDEPQRKKLFERFWKAGDFTIQNAVAVSRLFKLPNVILRVELSLDMLTLEFIMSEMKGCQHVCVKLHS